MFMTITDFEKGFHEVWKLIEATDKQIQETGKQLKATDQKIEKLIGSFSLFVEGLVLPADEKLFRERDIDIERISQYVEVTKNDQDGIDIVGVNGKFGVLIDAKRTLGVRDIDEHIIWLKNLKLFSKICRQKIIGAVAGIVIRNNAAQHAYTKGLFVIAQSGDSVKILNDQ